MHFPASRRSFLHASTAATIGSLWAGWSQAIAAQPKVAGKAKSVILIFNCGGPSHIDLWDPKPSPHGRADEAPGHRSLRASQAEQPQLGDV
jgi:hypothetical protein